MRPKATPAPSDDVVPPTERAPDTPPSGPSPTPGETASTDDEEAGPATRRGGSSLSGSGPVLVVSSGPEADETGDFHSVDMAADRVSSPSGEEAFDTTWVASDDKSKSTDRRSAPGTPTRSEAQADPLIGLVVADRYRIAEQIGRGAMGIVYRVEHTRIGKLLAMKLLAGELSTNKEIVRRFKQEALTVSKLSSPHTVQVFDYGVWQHLTFLVMELVEGATLARLVRRGGHMPFGRLGRLMVHVCASLQEAHAKGIVHRDIKPENIMILSDEDGTEVAKVLDFGLAKLREGSELNEMTLQGAVVGTPYFISPEQVLGEPVDGRTDIYSLGAVMFRALTGSYPFTATTPMGMFTKHLTEAPPAALERAPERDIPVGVSELVRKCLAKKPGDRFADVEELRDALVRELDALPSDSPASTVARAPAHAHKARGGAAPAATGLRRRTRSRPEKLAVSQIATRDEVEAYQRKLRRAKWVSRVSLVTVGLATAAGVTALVVRLSAGEAFTGRETEPNDVASHANALPLGATIEGSIGKRLTTDQGDRDFYVLDVPPAASGSTYVSINLSALPNMPLALLLYREGFEAPLARFRTGFPGQDLLVPRLRVDSGRYFAAVMQDLEPWDLGGTKFVYESISDRYRLGVSAGECGETDEVEPNDEPASAQAMDVPQTVRGTLGWLGDADVLCAPDSFTAPVRWRVEDEPRPTGAVLEATPLVGPDAAPLVRVHARGLLPELKARFPADVLGPWTSASFELGQGVRCLRLRLTADPWADKPGVEPPRPDAARYSVTLLR